MTINKKTTYILGAGFSVPAGAPTQDKLLTEAIRLHQEDPEQYDEKRFSTFKDFLTVQLGYSEEQHQDVELEDIFTPLDRCLSESSQFRGIAPEKIMAVRDAVFHVIGKTIQLVLNETDKSQKDYIDIFAEYLRSKSSIRRDKNYSKHDPVSVISTNWDILLDNSIHRAIQEHNDQAVVDYCCYISSRDEADHSIKPGLETLGKGGFNVKLLKLHGSLNWLQCPRCMRLYAKFSHKDGVIDYKHRESCRHCDANFHEEEGNHLLNSNLIMPTYIKDLSNPQYKIIWQNAGIEISEADKLVFIGYSLPNADFEMRQLLSRMSRKNVKIEVVDLKKDSKDIDLIKKQWSNFFGSREISFHFDGTEAYIKTLLT